MGQIFINNAPILTVSEDVDSVIAAFDLAFAEQLRNGNAIRFVVKGDTEGGQVITHLITPGSAVSFKYRQEELGDVEPETLELIRNQFAKSGSILFDGFAGSEQ